MHHGWEYKMSVEITDVKRTGPSRERVMFSDGSILYRIKTAKNTTWKSIGAGSASKTVVMKSHDLLYKKFKEHK